MREAEVNAFLTDLAVNGRVAASTQNQALAALLFLYAHVLNQPLDRLGGVVRANRPKRLPSVLTRDEVGQVLGHLNGTYRLMGELLCGGGAAAVGVPSTPGEGRRFRRRTTARPARQGGERIGEQCCLPRFGLH